MDGLNDILNTFEPITLDEMESVNLLDRTDTKFTFVASQLVPFLKELTQDYRVLEINGIRINKYETLYFDTPELKLYTLHHNGKLNRYKVRFRKYADSGLNFFEVKFKNNKGRTIKNRVKRKEFHEDIEGKSEQLLLEKTPLLAGNLKPAIWVNYSRITLVSKNTTERLTIDVGLNYKNNTNTKAFPNLVIAEVKQYNFYNSVFFNLMRKSKISDISISKYCLGIVCLYKQIKRNNFNLKIRNINKLYHENI